MGRVVVHCPQCGKENPSDALFCHYCKNELEGVKAEPAPPAYATRRHFRADNVVLLYLIIVIIMGIVLSLYLALR